MTPQTGNTALAIANATLSRPAATAQTAALKARADKTRGAAEDFEAVFLNTLFQQMFNGVGNGPLSGGPAAGVWRSMLTDQYARTFAKSGGIGIADHVQRSLIALQQAK
jgi:Rod binding domain-containing protein